MILNQQTKYTLQYFTVIYILKYFDRIVDEVRERTGQDKVNLLGYCMGGSMSAMYTALFPEKVKNLIMLAAPVDRGLSKPQFEDQARSRRPSMMCLKV